jgi:hypothetical protein
MDVRERTAKCGARAQIGIMSGLEFRQPRSGIRRVPLLRRCRLRGTGLDASGILCNISVDGAYLAVEPVPRTGDPVELSFQLAWREDSIRVRAVVSWDNSDCKATGLPAGCGVRFLASTSADRNAIKQVVRSYGGGR